MNQHHKFIIGVVGLPVRKTQKGWEFFLTQRYNPSRLQIHLRWQLAGGGMEWGETPEQTLKREFMEELRVTPEIIYPYPILLTHTWKSHEAVDDEASGVHLLLPAYLVSLGSQQPINVDPDQETGEIGWFSYEEILELNLLPKTVDYIEEARKMIDLGWIK